MIAFSRDVLDEGNRLREVAHQHLLALQAAEELDVGREPREGTHDALVGVRGILGADEQQDPLPFRGGEHFGGQGAAEKSCGAGEEDRGFKRCVGVHGWERQGWTCSSYPSSAAAALSVSAMRKIA